ncbi:MAG: glycosyltransferase [Pyrinomonadaceae bacterium]
MGHTTNDKRRLERTTTVEARRRTLPSNSEKIKVLLMLPSFHEGGAQRMALHLMKHLDRDLFDVRTGLLERSGHYMSSLSEADLISPPAWLGRLIDVERGHTFGYTPGRFLLRTLLAPVGVYYDLRKAKPHVVITFMQGTSFAMVPAITLYGRRKVRWIAREGNNTMASLDEEIANPTMRSFMGAVIRHCYNSADCVLTVSKDLGIALAERFSITREKVRWIFNAADLKGVQDVASHSRSVEPNSKRPYLISIGRLEHQKGHDILLKAFAKTAARTSLDLVILGTGSKLDELQQLARELGIESSVHFLGFRKNPWAYAADAEMFVLASRWEGFGNVMIEAMACGLPVIVTNCDFGPREMFTNGENGIVVQNENVDELAAAIDACHESEEFREKLRKGGRKRAEDFDIRNVAREYGELIVEEASKLASFAKSSGIDPIRNSAPQPHRDELP